MKKFNKKGFTITELVIVIAVIAILAAVLIPTFSNVISNAKQSAALQTASNAMKDYGAIAAENGESIQSGMVFVSDNHAFVYANGTLHYIDKLERLSKFDTGLNYSAGKVSPITLDAKDYTKVTLTLRDATPVVFEDTTLVAGDEHKAENLYVYAITINNTDYQGYFTLEGAEANFQTQGANYSRLFGMVAVDGETAALSVAVEPAA